MGSQRSSRKSICSDQDKQAVGQGARSTIADLARVETTA